jgi:diaminohydroxyphosphoribosylaminopyrimidine deaminase/5-amino-6-(5-phosphoribosylamino)uracil reductase
MTEDEKWMRRCLQLARCGETGAPPNPMVGAVIVCGDRIIGEGYHAHCGEGHAEVNAFHAVRHPELLESACLYVSLEPCAHFGRTPPCAKLIIEEGVKNVVVGMVDPFAKVNGQGIRMLREAGVKVTTGILESECRQLNKKFIVCQTHGRPFITLKWAQSADGLMAPAVAGSSPIFVSSPCTLIRVHHLRASHQAVLVGRRTAETDNPSLTLRYWAGTQPLRVAFDRYGVLESRLHLFDGCVPTLIVGEKNPPERNCRATYDFLQIDYSRATLPQLLQGLFVRGVQSLLVEGGRELLQAFIDEGLWDEAHVEVGEHVFHDGLMAPKIPSDRISSLEKLFGHTVRHYQNNTF